MSEDKISLTDISTKSGNLRMFDMLRGNNFGNPTMLVAMPIRQFYDQSQVANQQTIDKSPDMKGEPIAQRPLDKAHASALATYMLKGTIKSSIISFEQKKEPVPPSLLKLRERVGDQPYVALQPITVNLRKTPFGEFDNVFPKRNADGVTVGFQIGIASHHTLWVIDGQHRRFAMDMLFEFIRDIIQTRSFPSRNVGVFPGSKKGASIDQDEMEAWNLVYDQLTGPNTIVVEVHLGLSIEQERQLFHDLNKLVKRVAAGLALKFDTANPVNQFVNEHLINSGAVKVTESDHPDWHKDTGAFTRKDLTSINSLMFLGVMSEKKATPIHIQEYSDHAKRFWKQVVEIPHMGEPGSRANTVAAQPVVLKAIAKLLRQLGRDDKGPQLQADLLNNFAKFNYSHTNRLWRYYQLKSGGVSAQELETEFPKLATYLPSDDEGYNRDIGAFDNQKDWFRFSARTNDVIPILGDMFRWMISAPSRQKV